MVSKTTKEIVAHVWESVTSEKLKNCELDLKSSRFAMAQSAWITGIALKLPLKQTLNKLVRGISLV